MNSHPALGELLPCEHCTGCQWDEADVYHDDHLVMVVFRCTLCDSFGFARYPTESRHITFTGAFDV